MNLHFIESLQNTLAQASVLLSNLTKQTYQDASAAPYYSSIGKHMRHIIDFYQSIFNGLNNYMIDLTDREREEELEVNPLAAKQRIESIINELNDYKRYDLAEKYELIDDFGLGKLSIPTNLFSVFAQANSHSIHHYAIIAQLLELQGVVIEHKFFGYNPSTPKLLVAKKINH